MINNIEKLEDNSITKTLESISELVWNTISIWEIKEIENKKWFKQAVNQIISYNKENRKLALFLISEISSDYFLDFPSFHSDKVFLSLCLNKDYKIFFKLNDSNIKNKDFWKIVLSKMVKSWLNFWTIEWFIDKYFPKNKTELLKYYNDCLIKNTNFMQGDIWKILIFLKKENILFFQKILDKWLIEDNWKKIQLNKNFVNETIESLLEDNEYQKLDNINKNKYLIKILFLFLWIKQDDKIWKNEKYLLDIIVKLILNSESKKPLPKKEKELNDKKEKKEDINNEENRKINNDTVLDKDNFIDKVSYLYDWVNITEFSWWYWIDFWWPTLLKISTSEEKKLTIKALDNYIKFYNTLYSLDLNFLWDKHKTSFITLCNNEIWFDYLNWNWITDWKILSILNLLWKNIWIPETIVVDNQWNEKKEVRCFNDLISAKMFFKSIKNSWKINWVEYSDNKAFSYWAVENYLIQKFKIDKNGSWLNITKWI